MPPNLGSPAPATREGDIMTITRKTRDGRQLYYDLQVLQQPERARACGSGPKSSADRRPVDPPPVVQMKIYEGLEGQPRENTKDITYAYNADFFLYANLHHANEIGPGRLASANTPPPVLTGMPVSSMILLDRPTEAGYFIFSDLSVRHEGKYHLTFSLMEEVKEDRDRDADEAMSGTDEIVGPDIGPGHEVPKRCWNFRTTVTTDDFDVYSAKKFPGLQESTQLSRTVAEQGCRVRIRRDVRMRRREKGKAKDPSGREDEYARAAVAPPTPLERTSALSGRSASNASLERAPFSQQIHRRPSGMDFAPPRPSFTPAESSANRHPVFGGQPSAYPHPGSVPTSPSHPPPALHYGHRPSYPHDPKPSPTQGYSIQAAPDTREIYHRSRPPAHQAPPPLASRPEPNAEPQKQWSTALPPFLVAFGATPPCMPAPIPAGARAQPYLHRPDAISPSNAVHHTNHLGLEPHRSSNPTAHHLSPPSHHNIPLSWPPLVSEPSMPVHESSMTPTKGSTLRNKRPFDEAFPGASDAQVQNSRSERAGSTYAFSDAEYERASGQRVHVPFPPLA